MKNNGFFPGLCLSLALFMTLSCSLSQSQVIRELAVIDRGITGYEEIVGSINKNMTILLLGTEGDQIRNLTAELKKYTDLDALHLFVHGEDAVLMFDHIALHPGNIDDLEPVLSEWKQSFRKNGDLLIYSCDMARSCAGRELIRRISEVTGLDIAASTDLTGYDKLNGNWELEYMEGEIEAHACFDPNLINNFKHTLKVP